MFPIMTPPPVLSHQFDGQFEYITFQGTGHGCKDATLAYDDKTNTLTLTDTGGVWMTIKNVNGKSYPSKFENEDTVDKSTFDGKSLAVERKYVNSWTPSGRSTIQIKGNKLIVYTAWDGLVSAESACYFVKR